MSSSYWRFETAAVHAGYDPSTSRRSVAPPVYQTAAFAFDDAQHAADLFDGTQTGLVYSRIANPSVQMLEARVATLETGIAGVAAASGQAALACAFLTIASAGDNVVSAAALYGTTYNLLAHVLPQYGITTRFASDNSMDSFRALVDKNTKCIFCETISNPAGQISDLEALAEVAHGFGIPLIVDNTLATPYLCQPFKYGADISIHSLTKYLGGHGAALGGIVVDSGNFDWKRSSAKFPLLTSPDPSHHLTDFQEKYGAAAFAARCAAVPLRNLGAIMSPNAAISLMQGIETLPLRMERICFNAEQIAEYLSRHPAVSWVRYPGRPDSPEISLAQKYLGSLGAGVLSFGLSDQYSINEFQNRLRLIRRSVNLGDCKTLLCHPATTTHRQLSSSDLQRSGVSHDLLRISVGIEHIDDLIGDVGAALDAAKR